MREFYFNKEGYYDPTMGKALSRIWEQEKRKALHPMVLVLSADEAEDLAQYVARCKCRPVTMDRFLDQREAEFLQAGLAILDDCDEVWVFGKFISRTMNYLIRVAQTRGIEVRRMR